MITHGKQTAESADLLFFAELAKTVKSTCTLLNIMATSINQSSTLPVAVDSKVSIMDVGVKFTYQVPSFSAIRVDLRQVEIQVEIEDGSVSLYDGFMRDSPSLEKIIVPISIHVKDLCYIPVSSECTACANF